MYEFVTNSFCNTSCGTSTMRIERHISTSHCQCACTYVCKCLSVAVDTCVFLQEKVMGKRFATLKCNIMTNLVDRKCQWKSSDTVKQTEEMQVNQANMHKVRIRRFSVFRKRNKTKEDGSCQRWDNARTATMPAVDCLTHRQCPNGQRSIQQQPSCDKNRHPTSMRVTIPSFSVQCAMFYGRSQQNKLVIFARVNCIIVYSYTCSRSLLPVLKHNMLTCW